MASNKKPVYAKFVAVRLGIIWGVILGVLTVATLSYILASWVSTTFVPEKWESTGWVVYLVTLIGAPVSIAAALGWAADDYTDAKKKHKEKLESRNGSI